jgi:hypothetical protein
VLSPVEAFPTTIRQSGGCNGWFARIKWLSDALFF